MKKYLYYICVITGLFFGILIPTESISFSESIKSMIQSIFSALSDLSAASYLGNLILWIILVILFFTPFLILRLLKKKTSIQIVYVTIGAGLLLATLIIFRTSSFSIYRSFYELSILFLYLAFLTAQFYEVYIKDAINTQLFMKVITSLLIFRTAIHIPLSIFNGQSVLHTGLSLVINISMLILLYMINDLVDYYPDLLFQEETHLKGKNIQRFSQVLLQISIY